MKTIRIGSGAGYGGDRIEPAIDLIKKGNLDYIIFECLAERTIAIAQNQKRKNSELGYNDLLRYRFEKIFDVYKDHKTKIITNMGAANPKAAVKECVRIAKQKGLTNLKFAYVEGDDIYNKLQNYLEYDVIETKKKIKNISGYLLSANGYIGVKGIIEALENNADIIITGRVADPSLALAPLIYEFKWNLEDYNKLGKGTLVGHLLECAGQVTGGYFADPGYKDVPDLWNLGFPIAEVSENGDAIITKLKDSGGCVTVQTVKEQALYEIQDPANYYTPDVIADFSQITIEQVDTDIVKISNASGKAPNGLYKTSIGYQDCHIGEGSISYGGCNALEKAKLSQSILEKRFELIGLEYEEIRFDYIGMNSLYLDNISKNIVNHIPSEIRLRVAARTIRKKDAEMVGNEVEALYTNGPSGGGGVTKSSRAVISIGSILVPQDHFTIHVGYEEI